jgi:uncharacterized protein YukE
MQTVEDALLDVKKKKTDMEQDARDMLQADWRGDASMKFGQAMENHATDLQHIVDTLDQVVGVARHNIDVTYHHG